MRALALVCVATVLGTALGARPLVTGEGLISYEALNSSSQLTFPYHIEAESPFNLNYLGSSEGFDALLFEFVLRTDFDSDDWPKEAETCWSLHPGCCVPRAHLRIRLASECAGDAIQNVLLDGVPAKYDVTDHSVTVHSLLFWGEPQCSFTNQFVTIEVAAGGDCPPRRKPEDLDRSNSDAGEEQAGEALFTSGGHNEGSPCRSEGWGGCRYQFEALVDEAQGGAVSCMIEGNSYPWSWQPGHMFTQERTKERCPMTAFAAEEAAPGSARFFAMGDWGAEMDLQSLKVDQYGNQARVSIAMNEVAAWFKPQAMLSLGDNFYETGLYGRDDPAKSLVWRKMYDTFPNLADLPWYATLGNHDYGPLKGMPSGCYTQFTKEDAQFAGCVADGKSHEECAGPINRYYSPRWQFSELFGDPQWTLHNGSYSVRLGADTEVFIVDTTPIRIEADMDAGYMTADDIEYFPGVPFGVEQQDPDMAVRQLANLLEASNATVKILASHDGWEGFGKHGKTSFKRGTFDKTLKPLIKEHNIKLHVHAHDHIMQVCRDIAGPTHYLTAGSVYRTRPAVGKKSMAKNNTVYERLWYSVDPHDHDSEEPTADSGFSSVVVSGKQIVYSMWTIRGGCQFEQEITV